MAISVVTRLSGIDSAGAGGTVTGAFSSNTAGNTIIVLSCVAGTDKAKALTISDTIGNTYITVHISNPKGANGIRVWVAYSIRSSASTNTVTVVDNGNACSAGFYEVAGLPSVGAFDRSVDAKQTSSTTPTSGSITTRFPNELLLACSSDNGSTLGTYTAGTNWTNAQVPTAANGMISAYEERIVSAVGSYSGDFNLSATNGSEDTAIIAFADTPLPAATIGGLRLRPHAFSPGIAR